MPTTEAAMLLLLRTLIKNEAILRIRYVLETEEAREATSGFARERSSYKWSEEWNNGANLYIVHAVT